MEFMSLKKEIPELRALCSAVRLHAEGQNYELCESLIRDAMRQYPHAPEPHNLLGVVLEMELNHSAAMKHFRAAWALDPTYLPARYNLECYGTFFSEGGCAFDETDCPAEKNDSK